jgi:hypothetical protein
VEEQFKEAGSRQQLTQQFQDSSARKEGYSRQIQGLKQFQDSADWTRKKYKAEFRVHSDLSKTDKKSGSQRPGH